jgi:hypothetical protein
VTDVVRTVVIPAAPAPATSSVRSVGAAAQQSHGDGDDGRYEDHGDDRGGNDHADDHGDDGGDDGDHGDDGGGDNHGDHEGGGGDDD